MALSQRFTAQFSQELAGADPGEILHFDPALPLMPDAPDSSPCLVTLRMISRHLVVRNDFVIPIDDIETAIRSEMNRHRTEHRVVRLNEVRQLLQPISG